MCSDAAQKCPRADMNCIVGQKGFCCFYSMHEAEPKIYHLARQSERAFSGMLFIILPDLHPDHVISPVIHFLDKIIMEIEGSFFKAHGIQPVKQHFFGLLNIPAIDMI